LWLHETLFIELLKCHIRIVVDALLPRVFAHIVVSNLNESAHEDFESCIRLDSVRGVELVVNLLGSDFTESGFTIKEASELDVQVDVAQSQRNQGQ